MQSYAIPNLTRYLGQVISYRHFWMHLAFSDLRARLRRSYLGLLWIVLQPMLITIIIASVFKFVFKQSFTDYAIYVFSGNICWEFVAGAINIGALSFIGVESYVRQVRLPMMIYPLKTVFYCGIVFALSLLGFVLFALVLKPEIFSWTWVYVPISCLMMILFAMPLAIISAIVNIKFRDYQQLTTLALQILWYVSPVMMPRDVFEHAGLREWAAINPIAAILDVIRQPLIQNQIPPFSSYAMILAYTAILWVFAVWMMIRNERTIVFYY